MRLLLPFYLFALVRFAVVLADPKWHIAIALGLGQPRNQADYTEILQNLENLKSRLHPPRTNTEAAHKKRLSSLLKIVLLIGDLTNNRNPFGPGVGERVHSLYTSAAQPWLVGNPDEVKRWWETVAELAQVVGYKLNGEAQSNSEIGFLRFFTAMTWFKVIHERWIPDIPESQRGKLKLLLMAEGCTIAALLKEWDDEEYVPQYIITTWSSKVLYFLWHSLV